jgi:hypothetical protein
MNVDGMSREKKTRVAIAYLTMNKGEIPEDLKKLFNNLDQYNHRIGNIYEAIKQARASLDRLDDQMKETIGGMNAIADLIGPDLPADKIDEWCKKYNPPDEIKETISSADDKPDIDLAGSTSKKLPPVSMK